MPKPQTTKLKAYTGRPASKFPLTVDMETFEAAVVDKYAELFESDSVLRAAWEQRKAAEEIIYMRMRQLAELEPAQPEQGVTA